MHHPLQHVLELVGVGVGAAVLPFYLGVQHSALDELLLYCLFAGFCFTLAERLLWPAPQPIVAGELLSEFGTNGVVILTIGTLSYVAALILI